jgi:outer membrane immunogenic protein
MQKLVLASVAALAASPALSADLSSQNSPAAPPAVTQFNWTGAFVGANFGWGWGHNSFDTFNSLNGAYAGSGSINSSFPLAGAQAGYLYMLPSRFVFGGSASVDWNGSTSTTNINGAYADRTLNGVSGTVVGRAGYAFGDILPYVFGGWAWQNTTDVRTQLLGTAGGVFPNVNDQVSTVRNGWVLGPGLAYRFWKNWEVFGEYSYADFGNTQIVYPVQQRASQSHFKVNLISVGLNYKF